MEKKMENEMEPGIIGVEGRVCCATQVHLFPSHAKSAIPDIPPTQLKNEKCLGKFGVLKHQCNPSVGS